VVLPLLEKPIAVRAFCTATSQLKSVASPVRNVAEDSGRDVRRIRKVDYADERFHLRADGQSNRSPCDSHALGSEVDDAGNFRGSKARLTVNRARQRIASDRLANLTGYTSKGRY